MKRNTEKAIDGLTDKIDSLAKAYALCFMAESAGRSDEDVMTFLSGRTEQIKEDLIRAMTDFTWQTEKGTFDSLDDFWSIVQKAKDALVEQIMVQISLVCE